MTLSSSSPRRLAAVFSPRRSPLWTAVGSLSLALSFGCATTESGTTGDTQSTPQAPKPADNVEVDPHALCEVLGAVKDASGTPRQAQLRQSYEQKLTANGADRAAALGAMLAKDSDKDGWKALRDDANKHPGTALYAVGECIIYGWWKMDDQAEPRCQKAEAQLENLAVANVARGDMWLRKGDADKAIAYAQKALTTDPACGVAKVLIAEAHTQKGDTAAALSSWEQASKLSPNCFKCAVNRADLVERSQGQEAALPHWEAALKILPGHAKTLQRYAAVQVGRDDKAALAAYEKALELGQEEFATLMAAATLAVKTGDDLKAIDYGERAARVESDHVELWRLLGGLYKKRNEIEPFEKSMDEVLRLVPTDVEARLELARVAKADKRYVESLDHYDAAGAVIASDAGAKIDEALKTAYTDESTKLLEELRIGTGLKGDINKVNYAVQFIVTKLFEERHKGGKKGSISISVKTRKDSTVEEVTLLEDTLGDGVVAGSAVGNLRRAHISGGRKLYTLEFDFR